MVSELFGEFLSSSNTLAEVQHEWFADFVLDLIGSPPPADAGLCFNSTPTRQERTLPTLPRFTGIRLYIPTSPNQSSQTARLSTQRVYNEFTSVPDNIFPNRHVDANTNADLPSSLPSALPPDIPPLFLWSSKTAVTNCYHS